VAKKLVLAISLLITSMNSFSSPTNGVQWITVTCLDGRTGNQDCPPGTTTNVCGNRFCYGNDTGPAMVTSTGVGKVIKRISVSERKLK